VPPPSLPLLLLLPLLPPPAPVPLLPAWGQGFMFYVLCFMYCGCTGSFSTP
jgi:hypothetical protein